MVRIIPWYPAVYLLRGSPRSLPFVWHLHSAWLSPLDQYGNNKLGLETIGQMANGTSQRSTLQRLNLTYCKWKILPKQEVQSNALKIYFLHCQGLSGWGPITPELAQSCCSQLEAQRQQSCSPRGTAHGSDFPARFLQQETCIVYIILGVKASTCHGLISKTRMKSVQCRCMTI